MRAFHWLTLLISCLFYISCSSPSRQVVISDFETLTNFEFIGDTLLMEMDLESGPYRGIKLPSARQPVGKQGFKFKFKATNTSLKPVRVAYKIYYQNDSYKFSETRDLTNDPDSYNPKSAENFYGSWVSDTLEGFRYTLPIGPNEVIEITDEITIVGNPLNEKQYYGTNPLDLRYREIDVQEMIANIKSMPEWYVSIGTTAFNNKVDTALQLRKEAIRILDERKGDLIENQRWQRNPRVGSYRFMLVAGDAEAISELPNSILNIAALDPTLKVRINPFYYFKWGEGKFDALRSGITVLESRRVLKTFAVLRPDIGVYYRSFDYDSLPVSPVDLCSTTDELFMLAHFEQYRHAPPRDSSLNNVDLTAHVAGSNYTYRDYQKAASSNKRVENSFVEMAQIPCVDVFYDPEFKGIAIVNKGNENRPYVKQNAGVKGRVGFTYGKFRARIRFPEMLSKDHVWNGISCRYWLVYQSLEPWNKRDLCAGSAYEIVDSSRDSAAIPDHEAYSEIDFNLVKASKFWPGAFEVFSLDTSNYYPAKDHNLIINCVNWDLACAEPAKFSKQTEQFISKGTTYYTHRSSDQNKALTIKTENPHDQSVGAIYLYEIEWKPNSITWRLGADENSMSQMAYMDYTITKIPNNQMVPAMSQEFDYTFWWPDAPYKQEHIPYPAKAISGMIYEVVVE